MKWKPFRQGSDYKIFEAIRATVKLTRFTPGHAQSSHKYPYQQIAMILSGEVDFHAEGEVHRMVAGGWLFTPPNVEHFLALVGDGEALSLDVFLEDRENLDPYR